MKSSCQWCEIFLVKSWTNAAAIATTTDARNKYFLVFLESPIKQSLLF
jgi:hypothetical protein